MNIYAKNAYKVQEKGKGMILVGDLVLYSDIKGEGLARPAVKKYLISDRQSAILSKLFSFFSIVNFQVWLNFTFCLLRGMEEEMKRLHIIHEGCIIMPVSHLRVPDGNGKSIFGKAGRRCLL